MASSTQPAVAPRAPNRQSERAPDVPSIAGPVRVASPGPLPSSDESPLSPHILQRPSRPDPRRSFDDSDEQASRPASTSSAFPVVELCACVPRVAIPCAWRTHGSWRRRAWFVAGLELGGAVPRSKGQGRTSKTPNTERRRPFRPVLVPVQFAPRRFTFTFSLHGSMN